MMLKFICLLISAFVYISNDDDSHNFNTHYMYHNLNTLCSYLSIHHVIIYYHIHILIYISIYIYTIGTRKSLTPLCKYPNIIPKTEPLGFSNDFIGAEKGSRLMKQLIDNLPLWNWSFILPILTIFLSTGPLFLTNQYHAIITTTTDTTTILLERVYVLPIELYARSGGYLVHVEGK